MSWRRLFSRSHSFPCCCRILPVCSRLLQHPSRRPAGTPRRIALVTTSISLCTVIVYCLIASKHLLEPVRDHHSHLRRSPLTVAVFEAAAAASPVDQRPAVDGLTGYGAEQSRETRSVWSLIDVEESRKADETGQLETSWTVDGDKEVVDNRGPRWKRRVETATTDHMEYVIKASTDVADVEGNRASRPVSSDRYNNYYGRSYSLPATTDRRRDAHQPSGVLHEMKFQHGQSSATETLKVKNKNDSFAPPPPPPLAVTAASEPAAAAPRSSAVNGYNVYRPVPGLATSVESKISGRRYGEFDEGLSTAWGLPEAIVKATTPTKGLSLQHPSSAVDLLPGLEGPERTMDSAAGASINALDNLAPLRRSGERIMLAKPDGAGQSQLLRQPQRIEKEKINGRVMRRRVAVTRTTVASMYDVANAAEQPISIDLPDAVEGSPLSGTSGVRHDSDEKPRGNVDVYGQINMRHSAVLNGGMDVEAGTVSYPGGRSELTARELRADAAVRDCRASSNCSRTASNDGKTVTELASTANPIAPTAAASTPDWLGIFSAVDVAVEAEIPEIIHQTWDDLRVPLQVADWVRSWSHWNHNYVTWFWTDSGARSLFQQATSTTLNTSVVANDLVRLADIYDSYPHAIHRADVRKYLALYAVGGIVADLDTESLRPLVLSQLVTAASGRPCILAREPELHRAFVYRRTDPLATALFAACRPRHPFFRFVIVDLLPVYADNAHRLPWNDNVLNSTGPEFLTDAVKMYRERMNPVRPEDDVFVAPAGWFAPTIDPLNADRFRLMCKLSSVAGNGTADLCDRIQRRHADVIPVTPSETVAPYTMHHWLHSWSDKFVARGGLTDVRTVHQIDVLVT